MQSRRDQQKNYYQIDNSNYQSSYNQKLEESNDPLLETQMVNQIKKDLTQDQRQKSSLINSKISKENVKSQEIILPMKRFHKRLNQEEQSTKQFKSSKQSLFSNSYIFQNICQFLKNRDICRLQQVNKLLNQFKYKFKKLEIKKYSSNDDYVQNKINWNLKQILQSDTQILYINTQDLDKENQPEKVFLEVKNQLQIKLNLNQKGYKLVQEIHLVGLVKLDRIIQEYVQKCQNVQKLVLIVDCLQEDNLSFLQNLTHLQFLQIQCQRKYKITGTFLLDYCISLNLKELKIDNAGINKENLLQYLKQKGSSLKEVNINSNKNMDKFIDFCPKLTRIDSYKIQNSLDQFILKLKNYDLNYLKIQPKLQSETIQELFSKPLKKLQHIEIYYCEQFNDNNLIALMQNCTSLKSLSLSLLYGLTNKSLKKIGDFGQNYEEISFNYVKQLSNKTLCYVFENCRKLTKLSLSGIKKIKNKTFLSISQNCQLLESLDLTYCKFLDKNWVKEIVKIRQVKRIMLHGNKLCNNDVV